MNSYSEDWSLDTVFLLASNPIYKEEFAYKCTVRYLIKDQSEADKKGFRINNMEFHPVQTLYLTDSECQLMVQTKRCFDKEMTCSNDWCDYNDMWDVSENSSLAHCHYDRIKIELKNRLFDDNCDYNNGYCYSMFSTYSWNVIENNDQFYKIKQLDLISNGNYFYLPDYKFPLRIFDKVNEENEIFKTNIDGIYLTKEPVDTIYKHLNEV